MLDTRRPTETSPWAAYAPGPDAPWNLRRVVHLHRRAGFAATWRELQRDLADGPGPSIDRLLSGKARSEGVPENFEDNSVALADGALAAHDAERLKAWWIYRMYFGPDPLTERLALVWHNHFATSNLKVNNLPAMRRQNELFRKLGRAPFGELLGKVVRDPALLNWLDAPANRKGHPNENLGRELMELFTLGIGHYTETDVKEAARALTGWTVREDAFFESAGHHDTAEKTILGHKGRWNGDDLARLLLDHPATSERLAWRLCEWLLGEKAEDAAALKALAAGLRDHHLDIRWAATTVLRSRAFFAEANLGTHVFGPVEFVVGAARSLELLFEQVPNTLLLAEWTALLGQDLFYPPNVGGWPGGRSWINSRSLIGRTNYAAGLVDGTVCRSEVGFDAVALAQRHDRGTDPEQVLTFYAELLLGTVPGPAWRNRLLAALGAKGTDPANTARRVVALILASPEYQMA
jgi:uncharacterized protein (DUF1800 family)